MRPLRDGISRRQFGWWHAVNPDGTGFMTMHSFVYGYDGGSPCAGLLPLGSTLYGTTSRGANSDNGTMFSISFRAQLTIALSGVPPTGIIL